MENKNINRGEDFFLSDWLEDKISDKELQKKVTEEEYIAYQKLKKGIEVYSELNSSLENAFKEIQKKISKKKVSKTKVVNMKWAISIAASLVIVFGLYFAFENSDQTIATAIAEKKSTELLDGSEVMLNSKSSLSYNAKEWDHNRLVHLNGEAFFKVSKGKTFTVATDIGKVEVLGTQFNVNATDDFFEVTCFEGSVKVKVNGSGFILKSGESIRRINGNKVEKLNTLNTDPTWMHGESSFKSVPLKYVIRNLEKQYAITFISKDIDTSLIFTGSFSHSDLNKALTTVFSAIDITFKTNGNDVIVLSHRK